MAALRGGLHVYGRRRLPEHVSRIWTGIGTKQRHDIFNVGASSRLYCEVCVEAPKGEAQKHGTKEGGNEGLDATSPCTCIYRMVISLHILI